MTHDKAAFLKIRTAFPHLTTSQVKALIRDAFRAMYAKRTRGKGRIVNKPSFGFHKNAKSVYHDREAGRVG
jgi:hypothetical protein